MRYYGKALFWTKMVLMGLAGVNALYFHMTTYRSVAKWDKDPMLPYAGRVAGVLSLVLWAGVIIFGRLTAYNWVTYGDGSGYTCCCLWPRRSALSLLGTRC